MIRPKAILLDLDDTILNDSGNIESIWEQACHAHRDEFGSIDAAAVSAEINRVRDWYWADRDRHREGRLDLEAARRHVVQLALANLGIDREGLAARIGDACSNAREAAWQPLEGAMETLHWMHDRGFRLALLTNGSAAMQRRKIERLGLEKFFDAILIEGELGFGKPDIRVYRRALDGMSVQPSEAWMIGDNLEWDVAEPQRLGVFGVWIDVRDRGLPADSRVQPDRIVRGLSDVRTELTRRM